MTLKHMKSVENAISELKKGKMVILTDEDDRENEGDLIYPAELITPDVMNFMIRNTSGIVCLSLSDEKIKNLGLTDMVSHEKNNSRHGTPFTVSIEARHNVTTGVSAADRATTILTAMKSDASEKDIAKPGHIFPLRAKSGGVLERAGHTEGALDLVKLAGFQAGAVLCEVMNPDGTMAKGESLKSFAEKNNLLVLSIADLIAYRRATEDLIESSVSVSLPIAEYGQFDFTVYKEKYTQKEQVMISRDLESQKNPIIRIHSACLTGDLFLSERCDCHAQLFFALSEIATSGGAVIYLNQEGRGIGLFNKIKAYALQNAGLDTISANQALSLPVDAREYYFAANILHQKNISSIRLMTNNPHKIAEMKKYGIENVDRIGMPAFSNPHNQFYLKTKKEKLNHFIQEAI